MTNAEVILLVENDPRDTEIAQWAFENLGGMYRLMTVSDGGAAIRYLSGAEVYQDRAKFPMPAAVLLDLEMPEVSGFEVLEWIRRQKGLEKLPVIVLTASSYEPDIRRAYTMGASSFLTKPGSAEVLVRQLRDALSYWVPQARAAA